MSKKSVTMTVMAPRVVNVDGPVETKAIPDTESGIYTEYEATLEDEQRKATFDPDRDQIKGYEKEAVRDGYATFNKICLHDDPGFYQRCEHYNTLFCKIECSEYADRKAKGVVSRDPEDELNTTKR